MAEIEVNDVDKYERIWKISIHMPTAEVFEYLSENSEIPSDLIILFTSEGVLIDKYLSLAQQIDTGQRLFMFRKTSICLDYTVPEGSWESFNSFPVSQLFTERIDFKRYYELQPPFNQIMEIEEELFSCYNEGRKLYATYQLKTKRFEKIKRLTSLRFDASEALLKNSRRYYKSIKEKWKDLSKRSNSLLVEVTEAYSSFDINYNKIQKIPNSSIKEELLQSRFKDYGRKVYYNVTMFSNKILDLKHRFLESIKGLLVSSQKSLETVKNTSNNFFDRMASFQVYNQEALFNQALKALELYSTFRSIFQKSEATRDKSERSKYGVELLNMRSNITQTKEMLANLSNSLDAIRGSDKSIEEHLKRIGSLYKTKIISVCVKGVNEMKFLISDKITKFNTIFDKLNNQKMFLYVPLKLEEACQAAESELIRSDRKIEEIRQLYIGLCETIIFDHTQREDFLARFGSILPKVMCKDLIQPVVNRSHLRHLLKFSSLQETPAEILNTLSKDDLIKYYEGRLGTLEKTYSQEIEHIRSREKRLQEHLTYLHCYKEKISKDYENKNELLKEYTAKLAELRSRENSERFIKKFQQEVQNLKEKEQAFKRIHLLNLNHLIEENKKLKLRINN